jgi:hypothetical protein
VDARPTNSVAAPPASPGASPPTTTLLTHYLARIPAAVLDNDPLAAVWFADLLGQRRNYGYAGIDSFDALLALPKSDFMRLGSILNGLPLLGLFGGAIGIEAQDWRAQIGFDGWQFDQAIYVGQRQDFSTWDHAQGQLDGDLIGQRLRALGYTARDYRGAAILVRGNPFGAAKGGAKSFVVRAMEVLPGDGTLTATVFPDLLDATIDLGAAGGASLMENADYRAIAAALGLVVGAGLIPAAGLFRPAPQAGTVVRTPVATPRSLYPTALPAYRLAGFGLRDDGQAHTLVLALVYPAAADAAAAAPILRQRLMDYRPDPRLTRDGSPLLSDHHAPAEPSVVTHDGRAVLVQPLTIADERKLGLWLRLLMLDDTGFLRER